MAVIYYGEGTHDAGFVGFRVARTVGVADDYRQEYFSLREYSYATAHRLAYSLDRKWEAEAEEVKRQNRTIYPHHVKTVKYNCRCLCYLVIPCKSMSADSYL